MKLEDQVISLELGKKLKELGVKQESLWYWYICKDETLACFNVPALISHKNIKQPELAGGSYYSAFTVAELGEMLPLAYLEQYKGELYHLVHYKTNTLTFDHQESDKLEANARAKMLVYLIKNKFMMF